MSFSMGVDMVSIQRLNTVMERWQGRFGDRIFSAEELKEFHGEGELAQAFAAKEAFFKALGTGVADGVRWQDFCLKPGPPVSPVVSGRSLELLAGRKVHVSVSKTETTAVAVVVLDWEGD